jgi:hypothetical protein
LCPQGERKNRRKERIQKQRAAEKAQGLKGVSAQTLPELPLVLPVAALAVKVKNTFIDDFMDDQDPSDDSGRSSHGGQHGMANCRASSAPPRLNGRLQQDDISLSFAVPPRAASLQYALTSSPMQRPRSVSLQDAVVASSAQLSHWTADLPSRGSALHNTGICRPCGWYWKPGSCQNGADCMHCHICPSNERKNRRATRKRESRMQH